MYSTVILLLCSAVCTPPAVHDVHSNIVKHTTQATYESVLADWPYQPRQCTTLCPVNSPAKFRIGWNGTISAGIVLEQFPAHSDLLPLKPYQLDVHFGAGYPPRFEPRDYNQVAQQLMNRHLPVLETTWIEGPIEYRQTIFVTDIPHSSDTTSSYANSIALVRIQARNLTDTTHTAHMWVKLNSARTLTHRDMVILDDQQRLRFVLLGDAQLDWQWYDQYLTPEHDDNPRWIAAQPLLTTVFHGTAEVAAHDSIHADIVVPCFPADPTQITAIRNLHYDTSLLQHLAAWQDLTADEMQIVTPDPVVNDIYRASMVHLLNSPEIDPHTGQWLYKFSPHQKHIICEHDAWSLLALDLRGYHDMAGKYLYDSYVIWQSDAKPAGEFVSTEGYLSGRAALEGVLHGHKNGQTLWAICEHYKLSRDREWLDKVLPAILKSCDFIIRERNATKQFEDNGSKAINYGCFPRCIAADWGGDRKLAVRTDAYNYLGLQSAAEVLASIDHSRAKELSTEANDYRECIRDAVRRAISRSVKIKLPDGQYIPFVPSDLQNRTPPAPGNNYGLEHEGWAQWALYADCGFLWCVECGVFDADEPEVTWHLQFLAEYPVNPCFKGLPLVHPAMFNSMTFSLPLYNPEAAAWYGRDDVDHFVESFYSLLAAGLSPKTYTGLCHPMPVGGWNIPSTNGQAVRMLRKMLIHEESHTIHLGRTIPHRWLADGKRIRVSNAPTYFGTISYEILSHLDDNRIDVTINPPDRNDIDGLSLKLYLRHPRRVPIQYVTLNDAPYENFETDTVTVPADMSDSIRMQVRFDHP